MGKILRDLAHVIREKNGEQRGRTLNSYANEAVSCMARSVADKFSKREDVFFFPLKYFLRQFRQDSAIHKTILRVTRCHRRRERRLVSFL